MKMSPPTERRWSGKHISPHMLRSSFSTYFDCPALEVQSDPLFPVEERLGWEVLASALLY